VRQCQYAHRRSAGCWRQKIHSGPAARGFPLLAAIGVILATRPRSRDMSRRGRSFDCKRNRIRRMANLLTQIYRGLWTSTDVVGGGGGNRTLEGKAKKPRPVAPTVAPRMRG
jgi:hypothetical protein